MTAVDASASALEADQLLALYEQMAVIRATEKAAHDLFLAGLVKGTTHLAAGHEAVAVGASAALRPDDYVFATYRGHHHAMARGATPVECLAELMSKATGLCQAKGGSMHLTKASAGMLGSYAIVGAHLPIAVGAAWSAQLRGTGQVAVAFFGDGATNIGAFHEALNLAAVWALPVLFICENNLYMEYTPIDDGDRGGRSGRGPGPGLRHPGRGHRRQRRPDRLGRGAPGRGAGPGRRRADPARGQDLPALRAQPHRPGQLPAGRGGGAVAEPRPAGPGPGPAAGARRARRVGRRPPTSGPPATVAEAVAAAKAAPDPDPGDAMTDVWADGGSAWRT